MIVETLQDLVNEHKLDDKIELGGTFCLGKCQQGVCVTVDDELFSVSPDTVDQFFTETVLARV
jgi:NADH:ubiquinone oxidoreductase subunit E